MRSVLILYIPAIHQGYIQLFKKYKGKVDTLYVLGQDIINDDPLAKREIRQLSPKIAVRLTLNLSDYFKKVELANRAKLVELSNEKDVVVITSKEAISDAIARQYFFHLPKKSIIRESVFLRYDQHTVRATRKEIQFTGTMTRDNLSRQLIRSAQRTKNKSADYFLQVGAVLVPIDHEPLYAHNQRLPAPHEMHSVGDPRNYLPYGADTHQRTVLHAEQSLIAQAARNGIKTEGGSIYVTTFPCPDCCNNLAEAGIKKIYFQAGYSALSGLDVLRASEVEIIKVI